MLAGLAIVFALGGIKFFQVRKAMAEHASFALPPESVTSLVAKEEEWIPSLKAVGSSAAVQGVTVSTDEPGIVQKINFESGQAVKEGDLLVQLEVSMEQAQLRSAEAQMRLAAANLLRQQNLLKSRVSSQADFDSAQAQYDQAVARVEEVKALINKKTIRAPFSGVLGIRAVNLGQYLQSGAQVAPLQSLDPIYVNFWLPQQNLGQIAAGQPVARSRGWSSGRHIRRKDQRRGRSGRRGDAQRPGAGDVPEPEGASAPGNVCEYRSASGRTRPVTSCSRRRRSNTRPTETWFTSSKT